MSAAPADGADLDAWLERAERWLAARRRPKPSAAGSGHPASAADVAVFHDLGVDDERRLLDELRAWQAEKHAAGYAAIAWPRELGGHGWPEEWERAFAALERRFETPTPHEAFSVTVGLVAPTIRQWGDDEQRRRFVPAFLTGQELCCQLFSEPDAGSDLANVRTTAVRDGDDWIVTGQKVWSSGAQFAGWGEAICRTEPDQPKHRGMTAFLVPMGAEGVTVTPIRQMSGGSSFNEVFLDGVRIPDRLRLGGRGEGWSVALTTLGFERSSSGGEAHEEPGGSWEHVVALATHLGRTGEPLVRQRLADLYVRDRVRRLTRGRVSAPAGRAPVPGAEGSLGKLAWTEHMRATSEVVSLLLGPRLVADGGEDGTFVWADHVLGAPGYRIAGGSDEIQRTIIGERLLQLPREPRPAS